MQAGFLRLFGRRERDEKEELPLPGVLAPDSPESKNAFLFFEPSSGWNIVSILACLACHTALGWFGEVLLTGSLFLKEAFAGRQAGWVGDGGLVAAAGIV